jgi:uncharacterized protein (DUF2336 family)
VTESVRLTGADVAALLKDPSSENRAATAGKLGTHFTTGALSEKERIMAEEIFRLMARDVEVKVRKALSNSIKLSSDLPRDVAVALANDVAEVAIPVLEASAVLTDEDLLSIINSKPAEYQVAIAGREIVSEKISDALVSTSNEDVVARLVSNDGAVLTETTMNKVLSEFGHVQRISHPMAQREVLPIKIAERLVSLVSEKIRDHLVTHHDMSPDMATDLLLESRERATLNLLDGSGDAPDVLELVDQLHRNGRLSPTIILRALCMGDQSFFEAALAKKAGIPVANAYQLVHDRGNLGMTRLFQRAGMPDTMLSVARTALDVAEELTFSFAEDRDAYREALIERLLTRLDADLDDTNLDYLMAKLSGKGAIARHA